MSKGAEILTKALSAALEKVNPGLKAVLETHLRVTTGKGLELAYEDPSAFKAAVGRLFGEYSARLLEMVVIDSLKDRFGGSVTVESLEDLVSELKRIYGE
ncbi:NitrOD5 domain-containing protein [Thermococcus pacificus]|uniref:Nitrosopumilus output domain-containing protein n=1 Tax=Thermococcus pacificus TaxID=71998 RepID=A0A218P761_9EURY|nr:NitrOD5 domain-containing protein [Thermococcus pacificus]ASJ06617.1 hypothetical protein A3L08_04405 [Thermococcus pacificus]